MAASSSADIRVAEPVNSTGGVLVADHGTALPTSAAASVSAFANVGYLDENGVELTIDESTKKLDAWGRRGVRALQEAYSVSLKFTMIGTNAESLALAFGDANYAATTDGHDVTLAAGMRESRALVINAIDGDFGIRLAASDAVVTSIGAIQLVGTDAMKYELTVDLLPNASGVHGHIYIEDISA